jgi:hypothetical protein
MIFVFGSNEQGIHGAGSAKAAVTSHGAVLHQGFGPQGSSFAIPTCKVPVGRPGWGLDFATLGYYVECFLAYAEKHPDLRFQVTQIGCGHAGWLAYQVAPLFKSAPPNCLFDTAWMKYLGEDHKYWGNF